MWSKRSCCYDDSTYRHAHTHIHSGAEAHETSAAKQWSPLTLWHSVAWDDASQTAQCRKWSTLFVWMCMCVHTGVDSLANHSREVWSYEPMITKFTEVDRVDDCLFGHVNNLQVLAAACLCVWVILSLCVFTSCYSNGGVKMILIQ